MPADMTWKELYGLEHAQMKREGYPVPETAEEFMERLPIAGVARHTGAGESDPRWEQAYDELIALKRGGIRKDFPYLEPDGLDEILALCEPSPELRAPDDAEYEERVRGAWFGRCAAVLLGKPLEMGMDRLSIKEYLTSVDAYPLDDWVPEYSPKLDKRLRADCVPSTRGNVRYVQPDDDIHYTIASLLLAESSGENFTLGDAANNLLENIPYHWVWTADRSLYWNLVHMEPDIDRETELASLADRFNPYRESMCPHLKSDLWGYVTPAQPRRGARMIHRLGSLSATKNGLYGGMFMQGCVSAALSKAPDARTILAAGLSNIPRTCRLHEAIRNVVRWHSEAQCWEAVCDRIYATYGDWYFAGAINNLCFVTLALLEGNLDFERTITVAVMCGTDTDCNSANAGSVVGAAVGYERLPRKWIDPLRDDVRSGVAGFGCGTITGLARRTVAVRRSFDVK